MPESAGFAAPHHDRATASTGAEALRLLVDLIAGVKRDTHVRLPTELVVRAFCAPPR